MAGHGFGLGADFGIKYSAIQTLQGSYDFRRLPAILTAHALFRAGSRVFVLFAVGPELDLAPKLMRSGAVSDNAESPLDAALGWLVEVGALGSPVGSGARSPYHRDPSNAVAQDPQGKPAAPDDALSFEQILERLEGVVETLEQGDTPLEQALSAFERGVALARLGARRLTEAERRVELLLNDEEGMRTRSLDKELTEDE